MAYQLLVSRIDEGLRARGLSERKALLNAGLGVKTIYHIRQRGHAPKPEALAKLAAALGFPKEYLLDAAADGEASTPASGVSLARIFVRGAVQAGIWREAIEWEGAEWYSLTVPTDDRFPGVERFGLEVVGQSMNRLYPDKSIVIAVRFGDIARGPEPGERVVVLRRSPTDEYEATLKEYARDDQGRHILWPRSTEPEFQTPFVLGSERLPVSQGYETLPTMVEAGDFGHAAGEPDVVVAALVIGSFRRE